MNQKTTITTKDAIKIMRQLGISAKNRHLYVPIFKVPTGISANRSIKRSKNGRTEVRVNVAGRTAKDVASDLAMGIAISNGYVGYQAELLKSSLLREVLKKVS